MLDKQYAPENNFEVHYRYYQYNDGRANNGYYWSKREFTDEKEARKLIARINNYADDKLNDQQKQQLHDELIDGCCGGFFKDYAILYKITRKRIE